MAKGTQKITINKNQFNITPKHLYCHIASPGYPNTVETQENDLNLIKMIESLKPPTKEHTQGGIRHLRHM